MNQIAIHSWTRSLPLPEQRQCLRQDVVHLLAVTGRGTGQILDIGSFGISFGCLYPHTFPSSFTLDILDAKGGHLKNLHVRKVWESTGQDIGKGSQFELLIGVAFTDLSVAQMEQLEYLIDGLDLIDLQYPSLLR